MQRFELSDGKSNKFWEITVEGDSFTVRYGRIGTGGATSTKTFPSAGEARVEADKLIRQKTKKGYHEVAVQEDAAAPTSAASNELEEAIFADPDDLDAWAVYGDWLQEQGDPRGELVSLEVEAARGKSSPANDERRRQILADNEATWLGKVLGEALEMQIEGEEVLELEWKLGFIHRAKVRTVYDFSGPGADEILRALIKLESFKFIHELRLGVNDLEGDAGFEPAILALSKIGKIKSLRRLVVGDFTYEEQEITWVAVGSCERLWPVLPNLEHCKIRGSGIDLGRLEHAKLSELVIETAGLAKVAVRSLARAKLPALVSLEAWLGVDYRSEEGGGEHGDIETLRPMLTGEGMPKLRHLALKNCDYADDIAVALATAPIVAQLETLDLSMGTMADVGARAIIEHASHFQHLKSIDLDENCIDDGEVAVLEAKLGEKVSVGGQEPSEDEDDRYVSVSE